jgi:hypothetical protein
MFCRCLAIGFCLAGFVRVGATVVRDLKELVGSRRRKEAGDEIAAEVGLAGLRESFELVP